MIADLQYQVVRHRMAELEKESMAARLGASRRGPRIVSLAPFAGWLRAKLGEPAGTARTERPERWTRLGECPECGPSNAR